VHADAFASTLLLGERAFAHDVVSCFSWNWTLELL
jgi:hypothetical protein